MNTTPYRVRQGCTLSHNSRQCEAGEIVHLTEQQATDHGIMGAVEPVAAPAEALPPSPRPTRPMFASQMPIERPAKPADQGE